MPSENNKSKWFCNKSEHQKIDIKMQNEEHTGNNFPEFIIYAQIDFQLAIKSDTFKYSNKKFLVSLWIFCNENSVKFQMSLRMTLLNVLNNTFNILKDNTLLKSKGH